MIIRIGQVVTYRPGWGYDPPKRAKVLGIERVSGGDKYGTQVDELDLAHEQGVVDLSDSTWAYTHQIVARG